jgi:hypothetical protein
MKKTLKDLYGTWLLFFYYIKWPIFFGLPLLYLEMDYEHDMVMDILWVYSAILIITELYQRFISKSYCDKCK